MSEAHVETQYADLAHQDHSGHFGMWVFITTEILFFAAVFALYAGYREHYPHEFEEAVKHSKLWIGTANTYILITSSLFVVLSVDAIRKDKVWMVIILEILTILFGLAFMVLKGIEYAEHIQEGIRWGAAYKFEEAPSQGVMLFFTLYYFMTGLHALHVLIGIGLFVWLLVRTIRGHYSSKSHLGVELVGIYWHFVDLVWIFLWPAFYLIH